MNTFPSSLVQDMIDAELVKNGCLVRAISCRKCNSEAAKHRVRCSYCNLKLEYLTVKFDAAQSH